MARGFGRGPLRDSSAPSGIGRVDRREKRCSERLFLHARAGRLRLVCAPTVNQALSRCVHTSWPWPDGEAHARDAAAAIPLARLLAVRPIWTSRGGKQSFPEPGIRTFLGKNP